MNRNLVNADMLKQANTNRLFIVSLVMHIAIFAVFILSFEWSTHNFVLESSNKNAEVINAVMVNDSKIELPEPTPFPPASIPEPPKKVVTPRPVVKPPVKVEPEIKKAVEPVVHPKAIAIPDPHKKQQQKELMEKQLLDDLKQAQQQKKKKHKELEKSFAKELKAQAAKSLQQQLLSEQNRLSSAQSAKMQGIVDKYKALILSAIGQHWLVPNGVNKSLSTQLLIRIAPGGTVLDVQLVKSSGDDALDRSARTAVFKASPLPVPTDSGEFEPFRQFILKVKPENVLTREPDLNG